ncbi:hypothetical protein AN958_11701 [Leucoagaricus sp. SymC.cos]|nr:hypothetical protein AN958_11701 [Leucoagaricus sp. SymC.cos]
MNFIRPAKSGSDWSKNELIAYNISVSPVPAEEFFLSVAESSLDHLDPNILTAPAGAENRIAQTDVCLLHRPITVLLVLIEDKTLSNRNDAESQVIAEAIAAFQFNNQKREEKGLASLTAMTIPCITMSGTRPTFYLVPVTQELSTAVIGGVYPATETRVLKCVTVVAHTR